MRLQRQKKAEGITDLASQITDGILDKAIRGIRNTFKTAERCDTEIMENETRISALDSGCCGSPVSL